MGDSTERSLCAGRPAVCSISLDKLYALDKRCSRATLSRLGGINAKADPGDTRCPTLVEVSFERSVEVEFGDHRLIRFWFAQANEAAAHGLLFVLWWIVEFLNFAGRIGMDPLDVNGVAILAAGGWLALRAWQARCPRCGNRFFVNSGLPLGFHLSSECPYCGQSLHEVDQLSG